MLGALIGGLHCAATGATVAARPACRLVDEVPYDATTGQIIVSADLGGTAPRRFILDTGAYENYVWTEEANALGWKPQGQVVRRDASTSEYVVSHVHGKRVAIGEAAVPSQSFATKPRGMRHADGFLGWPVISPFAVDVDFVAHRLRFWTAACDRRRADTVVLPLRFVEGRMPVVDATLAMPKGEPLAATLMVDTGAGATAIFNTPFVERHGLVGRAPVVVDQQTGSVGGGQSRLGAARARELRLAGFALARPIVLLGRQGTGTGGNGTFGAEHPWDGVLGCGILSRFHVTIDYPHSRLLLRPNSRFVEPFRQEIVQMLLADTAEGPKVVALRPGGAADRAGLRADDVILAVAGPHRSPLSGPFSMEAFWELLRRDGTYAVDVRRGRERHRLTLVVKETL